MSNLWPRFELLQMNRLKCSQNEERYSYPLLCAMSSSNLTNGCSPVQISSKQPLSLEQSSHSTSNENTKYENFIVCKPRPSDTPYIATVARFANLSFSPEDQ